MSLASCWAAGPSRTDCGYYKQIEEEYKCGPKGYPLKFGYPLCQKYLKSEPNLSKNLKKWFPKVRHCLQDYIERKHGSIRDCQDLKVKALNSHIGCYKQTGFCELYFSDRLSILNVTSTDIFNGDVVSLAMKVTAECDQLF